MYPQIIPELKVFGQLTGNRNEAEFALAVEQGFSSGGWKGALTKGVELIKGHRKTGYSSAFGIATMYAQLGEKDRAPLASVATILGYLFYGSQGLRPSWRTTESSHTK
jgi:hypothetical protein